MALPENHLMQNGTVTGFCRRLALGRNMAKPVAEIIVTILNFSGATVLCIDALRIKRSGKERIGAEKLVQHLESIGKGELLTDKDGNPLNSKEVLEEWLGRRTEQLGWTGFVLLALGFLLDLIVKLIASS